MPTLEELKRRYAQEKAIQEVRADMRARQREKKEMRKKLFAIKHRKTVKVMSFLGSGAKRVVKSTGKTLKRYAKSQARARPRRRMGFAQAMGSARKAAMEYQPRQQSIVAPSGVVGGRFDTFVKQKPIVPVVKKNKKKIRKVIYYN